MGTGAAWGAQAKLSALSASHRSVARSCFFLAKGMDDGSLGKEVPLKSISDEVVFCHPIIPKGTPF